MTAVDLLKLPDATLCSSCQLSYLRTVSKSAFLGYTDIMVRTYRNVTARCQAPLSTTPAQFAAYNPSVTTNCANLVNAAGAVICVTSPDGAYNETVLPGTGQQDEGEYALEAVPPPGPTPFLTTPNCGRYYQVQVADTCNRVSLSSRVRVDLFQAINPSIDADCFNLVPDLWYCVRPLAGWNATGIDDGPNPTSSQTVAPPGPTQTGTTGACYKWRVVVSGDTCFGLQQTEGVTYS